MPTQSVDSMNSGHRLLWSGYFHIICTSLSTCRQTSTTSGITPQFLVDASATYVARWAVRIGGSIACQESPQNVDENTHTHTHKEKEKHETIIANSVYITVGIVVRNFCHAAMPIECIYKSLIQHVQHVFRFFSRSRCSSTGRFNKRQTKTKFWYRRMRSTSVAVDAGRALVV